jgi:hypothetical protein
VLHGLVSLFEPGEFELLAERLELRTVTLSQPEQLRREWMSVSGDAGIIEFDEVFPAFSSLEDLARWRDLHEDATEWLSAKVRPREPLF